VIQQNTYALNEMEFTNLDEVRQLTVYTATKYFTESISTGEVILNARLNKHEKNLVKLKDMLCVPNLRSGANRP